MDNPMTLTREEAETLYAKLGEVLGKGGESSDPT